MHQRAQAHADRLKLAVLQDPCLLASKDQSQPLKTAEEVRSWILQLAIGLILRAEAEVPTFLGLDLAPADEAELLVKLAEEILHARPQVWSDNMHNAALSAKPYPGVPARLNVAYPSYLIVPVVDYFPYIDEDLQQEGIPEDLRDAARQTKIAMGCVLVQDVGERVALFDFLLSHAALESGSEVPGIWVSGAYLPKNFITGGIDSRLQAVWQLSEFAAMKLVHQVPFRADRAAQRRMAKAPLPIPAAYEVQLLREYATPESIGEGEASSQSWSRRWQVRGHMRWQWVGEGRKEQRLTWVRPHIKGPADKPLVIPQSHVIR